MRISEIFNPTLSNPAQAGGMGGALYGAMQGLQQSGNIVKSLAQAKYGMAQQKAFTQQQQAQAQQQQLIAQASKYLTPTAQAKLAQANAQAQTQQVIAAHQDALSNAMVRQHSALANSYQQQANQHMQLARINAVKANNEKQLIASEVLRNNTHAYGVVNAHPIQSGAYNNATNAIAQSTMSAARQATYGNPGAVSSIAPVNQLLTGGHPPAAPPPQALPYTTTEKDGYRYYRYHSGPYAGKVWKVPLNNKPKSGPPPMSLTISKGVRQ